MKSFPGKFTSVRGWALLPALLLGAGIMISACGDEEAPAPTTPAPPAPVPPPEPTGPATPEGLLVTGITSSSLTWSWGAVEGAIGYNVQFGPNSLAFTDTTPPPQPTTNTFWTVSNLAGNTTIHLRVRTIAGTLAEQVVGDWSDPAPGTTALPPAATALDAPQDVRSADQSDDSVTLVWDRVANAGSYAVEQREPDGDDAWGGASCGGVDEGNVVDEEECVASGLASGTDYDFRVQAIPSDTERYSTSDWSVVEEARTEGTTPTPGGMGTLNIRWHNSGANNADIVFVWDRQGDAMYETAMLAVDGSAAANLEVVPNVHVENPCKDVNSTGSSNEPRYESVGSATSQNLTTTAPGTIMGLCVRVEDGSEVSFAWGISPAEEPNNGIPDVDENKTVELTWTDVDLKAAFNYEVSLAADPERPASDNTIGADSAATSRAVQAACDNGREIDSFTPEIDLDNRTVSVASGLNPHIGYLLCTRASNGAGTGAWAVPDTTDAAGDDDATYATDGFADEIYTRPAAPPRPSPTRHQTVEAAGAANEKWIPAWEIGTQGVNNVPRIAEKFTAAVWAQNEDARDAAALGVAACSMVDGDLSDYTRTDLEASALTDSLSGFRVEVTTAGAIERVGFTRRVYLCVHADSTESDKTGTGDGPWNISPQFSVTKPTTSLKTKSGSVAVTEATIVIEGWRRSWYYKTNSRFSICTAVAEGTVEAQVGQLSAGAPHTVTAWDDIGCEETRLGSTSFRTMARPE